MYIGITPTESGQANGLSLRASDSKSPSGPVANSQWKYTGSCTSPGAGPQAGASGLSGSGVPPMPRSTPASKAGTRQAKYW